MAFFKNCVRFMVTNGLNTQQQLRYYPRWTHRTPARVLDPKEYENMEQKHLEKTAKSVKPSTAVVNALDLETETSKDSESSPDDEYVEKSVISNVRKNFSDGEQIVYNIKPTKKMNLRTPNTLKAKTTTDMLETVIDKDGNYVYTKMKNKDLRITEIFVDVKSRRTKGLMLLEGKRLIQEALLANCKLEYLLFSRKSDLDIVRHFLPKTGSKLYKMPYKEMQMWSDLNTSPGMMGIFKIPDLKKISSSCLPLTVICDNVREPGNLGAVLRASAAVGCKKVILTKGCTYLWDTKVLRSACGSHFKLSVETKLDWPNIENSLDENSNIFIADNNIVMEEMAQPSSTMDLPQLVSSLPLLPYYSIDYNLCKHVVVIIGGETEGISADAYSFAARYQGARINVPMSNEVDSLNTGTALGIICFEIKRQLTMLQRKQKEAEV